MLEGIKQNSVYLSSKRFTVYTDHKALVWLHKTKDTNAKLGRWALQLQNYDFEVVYREGKNNQNADAISRMPHPPASDKQPDMDDIPSPMVNAITGPNLVNESHLITEISFEYDHNKPYVAVINDMTVGLDNVCEIAKLQRDCPELKHIITYLEKGELPDENKKARAIVIE